MPVIGVDFDNTIVSYDALLGRLAVEQGLPEALARAGKTAIRDRVRQGPGGDLDWQRLQGLIYGPRMAEAEPVAGARATMAGWRRAGWRVCIISHKTEFAACDPTRTNLRTAAWGWLERHGFFGAEDPAVAPDQVYFEATRTGKLERIAALGCRAFIDDLVEVFEEPGFPDRVVRLLYRPDDGPPGAFRVCRSWPEIADAVAGLGG